MFTINEASLVLGRIASPDSPDVALRSEATLVLPPVPTGSQANRSSAPKAASASEFLLCQSMNIKVVQNAYVQNYSNIASFLQVAAMLPLWHRPLLTCWPTTKGELWPWRSGSCYYYRRNLKCKGGSSSSSWSYRSNNSNSCSSNVNDILKPRLKQSGNSGRVSFVKIN